MQCTIKIEANENFFYSLLRFETPGPFAFFLAATDFGNFAFALSFPWGIFSRRKNQDIHGKL